MMWEVLIMESYCTVYSSMYNVRERAGRCVGLGWVGLIGGPVTVNVTQHQSISGKPQVFEHAQTLDSGREMEESMEHPMEGKCRCCLPSGFYGFLGFYGFYGASIRSDPSKLLCHIMEPECWAGGLDMAWDMSELAVYLLCLCLGLGLEYGVYVYTM